MVLPLRSIPTAKSADTQSAGADPLDALASQLHDVLASDHQPRLAKARVGAWVRALLDTLFPQAAEQTYGTAGEVRDALDGLAADLRSLLRSIESELSIDAAEVSSAFFDALPEIHHQIMADATAIERGDPAAESVDEVILAYPGFLAMAVYRIAHRFSELGVPLLPRVLTEWAHERTGIDIHPGATIGRSFCIDHGTGIVIGETAVIGDDVKVYQGVTLGALSVSKSAAGTKRHPTIEDRVVLYANATVLGADATVGHDSVIGGNVWLTTSVPPRSFVYHSSQVRVRSVSDALDYSDYSI